MADESKPDADPTTAPAPKSFQDLLWQAVNRIFKREAILVGVLIAAGAFGAIKTRAWAVEREQVLIDAGVGPVKEELTSHKKDEAERYTKLEAKVEEIRKESAQAQYQTGRKLDAMLFRFAIPNPAPTPPNPDAGP